MRTRLMGERGSVTIWLVLAAAAMTMIVGLVVDLGGKVHAMQRARDVAAQAARAAGEQVTVASAMRGDRVGVAPAAAAQAARRYLAAAHMQGTVTFVSPTTLRVQVSDSYQPIFLTLLGVGSMRVDGEATAYLARAVNGAQR